VVATPVLAAEQVSIVLVGSVAAVGIPAGLPDEPCVAADFWVCAGCVAVRVTVHSARGTWPSGIRPGCCVPRREAICAAGRALAWVPDRWGGVCALPQVTARWGRPAPRRTSVGLICQKFRKRP
jgi:hypothetical protein